MGDPELEMEVLYARVLPRQVEFLVEAFNLFNTFNWGAPISSAAARTDATLSSGSFGPITSMTGTSRLMQIGIKFRFD